jgi:uncharacterized protein (TIGR02466 family)
MFSKKIEYISKFFFNQKFYKITNILNKLIGFFNKNKKNLYYEYKFYRRKSNKYTDNFLSKIYPPKVFLIKNINFNKNIFKKIENYKKNNPINKYDSHGHKNTYQSLHDLNVREKDFGEISGLILEIIKKKIVPYYNDMFLNVKLEKLWFTITKKEGIMKKHHHPDGELSGVLYLKCDKVKKPGSINLYNYSRNLFYFEAKSIDSKFLKYHHKNKIIKHNPQTGDLLIFESYLDHEVKNSSEIKEERISMPFDIRFDFPKQN